MVATLVVLVGMILTWRFLVGGLWIGLSGNRRLFTASAIPYAVLPVVALIGGTLLFERPFLDWLRHNLDRVVSDAEWTAAIAVAAKVSITAFSLRRITSRHVRQYVGVWLVSTLCLIALTLLIWARLQLILPADILHLRNLSILFALLLIPLARPVLATLSLAKNRHR
jgi:hypothetical protein